MVVHFVTDLTDPSCRKTILLHIVTVCLSVHLLPSGYLSVCLFVYMYRSALVYVHTTTFEIGDIETPFWTVYLNYRSSLNIKFKIKVIRMEPVTLIDR